MASGMMCDVLIRIRTVFVGVAVCFCNGILAWYLGARTFLALHWIHEPKLWRRWNF